MPNKPISQHTTITYQTLPGAPNYWIMQPSTSATEAFKMEQGEMIKSISRSNHADYLSEAALILDQVNQVPRQFYYVDGIAYFEYLGTTFGDITDYRAVSATGGGGVTEEKIQFDSDLDVTQLSAFRGSPTIQSIPIQAGLTAITLETSLDQGATWIAQADITALNSWIGLNTTGDLSTGTDWMLRITGTFSSGVTSTRFAIINYTR